LTDTTGRTALRLPHDMRTLVDAALARAVDERWAARLWQRDVTLWSDDAKVGEKIANRLGWLDAPLGFRERAAELEAFAHGVMAEGFESALVAGMGGSSLAPEVLARSLPRGDSGIRVRILDSTDPQAVRAAQAADDPLRSLCLVASKSGTTTETLAFLSHFWQVQDDLHTDIPASAAGQHFVAITDPGHSLEAIPHTDLFRNIFLNPADVGGRYSALTYVGLVPAALMGLDLATLLDDAVLMAERCREPEARNPGLWLGVALGALAAAGRDKLTFAIEPRIAAFGAWAEQLVAESTGKQGRGIVPVDGEPLGPPEAYGDDRVFVRLAGTADERWLADSGAAMDRLAAAGHPVIDLALAEGEGLGGEFMRWMVATAFAGAVLGVNPFDEPNVTESKDNTGRVLDEWRAAGRGEPIEALASEQGLVLIGDAALRLTGGDGSLADGLRRHLDRLPPTGYVAIQAYVAATPERDQSLREIQRQLRDRTRRAVTVGYGPRFLHSTGQLHKGGPPSGLFIQLTADHPDDLPIPGRRETFGTLIDAQALGDFQALETHRLPVARVHLGADVESGLSALTEALERAAS
jgi:transaldolase / glucose-6-phosphate isomerase